VRPFDDLKNNGDGKASDWASSPHGTGSWNGLENINFNILKPGDELYIIGTHVLDVTDSVTSGRRIVWVAGGSPSAHVTYRGDFPGEPGLITSLYKDSRSDGIRPGQWIPLPRGLYYNETSPGNWPRHAYDNYGLYETFTNEDDYIALREAASLEEVDQVGEYYMERVGNKSRVFVYPHDPQNLTKNNVRFSGVFDYRFVFGDAANYVTWYKLKLFGVKLLHEFENETKEHHHWKIDSCKWVYSRWMPWGKVHHVTVTRCELDGLDKINVPIYLYGGQATFSDWEYSYNRVHNTYAPGGDGHGLGVQGGITNLHVIGNHFHDCGSGIVLWTGQDGGQHNVTIQNNLIENMDASRESSEPGNGIVLSQNNDYVKGTCSNIFIQGNVVRDPLNYSELRQGIGIKSGRKETTKVYNNTVSNCNVNYHFVGVRTDAAGVDLRNNISLNPRTYHVFMYQNSGQSSNPVTYQWIENYNSFYPVSGNDFFYSRNPGTRASDCTYTEYNSAHLADGIAVNSASITLDPLLNSDLSPRPGSPVIDSGDPSVVSSLLSKPTSSVPSGSDATDLPPFDGDKVDIGAIAFSSPDNEAPTPPTDLGIRGGF
jgi:hypothetical protein